MLLPLFVSKGRFLLLYGMFFPISPLLSNLFCHNYLSGDRTPKQKVKLKVTEEKLLNLMLKYNGGRPRAEVFLASKFEISFGE